MSQIRRHQERSLPSDADASSRIDALNEQVAVLERERASLTYDQMLLSRADDIEQLRDRRIQIRAGKADLPKRQAELAAAEATLNSLAAELDWTGDIDQLIAAIPARAKVARMRALLNRRGESIAAVANARAGMQEAEAKVAEIAEQIGALGTPADISRLAATLKATRAMGDIDGQIANSKRQEQGCAPRSKAHSERCVPPLPTTTPGCGAGPDPSGRGSAPRHLP
jgi:chromosome segregation ATPase